MIAHVASVASNAGNRVLALHGGQEDFDRALHHELHEDVDYFFLLLLEGELFFLPFLGLALDFLPEFLVLQLDQGESLLQLLLFRGSFGGIHPVSLHGFRTH